jgi:nitrate reductase gamma subunit
MKGHRMDLLTWARGPLLTGALFIFVAGVAWRLFSLWRMPASRAPSAPAREAFGSGAALSAAFGRMIPSGGFHPSATLVTFNPYVFHIGLAVIVFGYAPHITFIRQLTGLSWPSLPDTVMYLSAAITIISLLMALMFRLTDPVLRKISKADDWITWTITMLPLLTGMALVSEPSAAILARDHVIYPGPLAVHLLSVELLLVWFPFGKLMHAFLVLPSRMQLATFFGRRGVRS